MKFQIKENIWGIPLFGKYKPNITFLVDGEINEIPWESKKPEDFNFFEFDGELSSIAGKFFISKNQKPCFSLISKNLPHLLICAEWGGPYKRTRGEYPFPQNIYYRRASSNGGGLGNTYWVIPVGWKYSPPEGDYNEPNGNSSGL